MATLLITATALLLLIGALGWILEVLSRSKGNREEELIDTINQCLPQTQCAQCGYPGCRPYAQAIAEQNADINLCPPGGEATIKELATLLDRPLVALASTVAPTKAAQVAIIDEAVCIGCALCIPACPVDAIVGARKYMHTVITHDCTGCELCLPPCPVDCIELVEQPKTLADWHVPKPAL
ncbi:MAG: electron transport complex subunit RsxB [Gammaproteobacteria bacterium]|nr:electron transport complex subunit RsxB [Gammaproteobacteria bacterium]